MKACVTVETCNILNETTISVGFHVHYGVGRGANLNVETGFSSSATQINTAIKARVVEAAPEFGATGLGTNDVVVFGGVS